MLSIKSIEIETNNYIRILYTILIPAYPCRDQA